MSISSRATATLQPVSQYARIVSDAELQKALDFLRDNAVQLGNARAEMVRAGHMLKVTKAIEMKRHNEMSAAKAEVEAYTSDAYKKALCEDAAATGEFEAMKALREAAAMKIEAWRSEQANYRAMKV